MHTCTTQEARAKLSSWSPCWTLTSHTAVFLWTSLHSSVKSWHSPWHWRENQTLNWRNWESYSCQRKRLQGVVNWNQKRPSYTIWTWRKRRTIEQTVVSVWILIIIKVQLYCIIMLTLAAACMHIPYIYIRYNVDCIDFRLHIAQYNVDCRLWLWTVDKNWLFQATVTQERSKRSTQTITKK